MTARPAATHRAESSELDLSLGRRLAEGVRGSLQCGRDRDSDALTVVLALPSRRAPRVLVVDNNADFIALVARYLYQEDWEVVGAGDATQALERAREMRPRIILLDVMMPGRDGWDLLVRLRAAAETKETPVIVCSILNEPQLATSLGANGYLPKPLTQTDLLRALAPWRSDRPAESSAFQE
jgi:CheY-like chemotaxis protein